MGIHILYEIDNVLELLSDKTIHKNVLTSFTKLVFPTQQGRVLGIVTHVLGLFTATINHCNYNSETMT